MAPSEFKKVAFALCVAKVRALGYTKGRSEGPLLRDQGNGTYGWIGLGTQDLPGEINVYPVVGVRHRPFEKLLLELTEDFERPIATVGIVLGELTPWREVLLWQFTKDDDPEPIAANLAEVIVEYGEPFIAKFSDWETVSKEVESTPGIVQGNNRMIWFPIIRAMSGDIASARETVGSEIVRIDGHADMYALAYRKFARRFLERFTI